MKKIKEWRRIGIVVGNTLRFAKFTQIEPLQIDANWRGELALAFASKCYVPKFDRKIQETASLPVTRVAQNLTINCQLSQKNGRSLFTQYLLAGNYRKLSPVPSTILSGSMKASETGSENKPE